MFSCGKSGEQGWRVLETRLDTPGAAREITPPDQPGIDYYGPC